jgi:hypothetical protein
LLFRGYGLEAHGDYEACMESLGVVTSDFLGTAPRARVGKYIVQNVSFEPKLPPTPPPHGVAGGEGGGEAVADVGNVRGGASVGHVSDADGRPMDALREAAGMV